MIKNPLIVTLIIIALTVGCSSGKLSPIQTAPNPMSDNILMDSSSPILDSNIDSGNHIILNTGIFDFDINNQRATVINCRALSEHFNVTLFVPQPEVQFISFDPITGIVDVDVTIENPTMISGYDVRLIIFTDDSGVRLTNGDDWTGLFDIPGGSKINPFKAYAKLEQNRIFEGESEHTERIQIYLPNGVKQVTYAVDASSPSNCIEPYSIEDFSQSILKESVGSQATIEVSVFDWQEDVSDVFLYCPSISGTNLVPFTQVDSIKWSMNLVNSTGASAGEYSALILAKSNDSIYLFDMVKISVSAIEKAKWTIFYYVYEENLYSFRTNLNEMEVVGSVDGIMNVVCLWDKPDTPNDCILEIHKDPEGNNHNIISPEVEDYGEVIPPEGLDMHDPDTLYRFLRWGFREYPAEHFGLTLLSHGNGGVYGFPPEKSFFDDMGVWEFNAAARAALDEYPNIGRLEFVGLESCTMAFLETAYGLRGCTKIAWSSEYVMWVSSAQYDVVLSYMLDNIDTITGREFASVFIHNALDTGGAVTYAAWDSDLTESVVIPSLNVFSQKLIDYLPTHRDAIEACRFNSDDWGSECTDSRITDLGYFAQNLIGYSPSLPVDLTSAASNLIDSIRTACYDYGVLGTGSGCYYSATGWQILFTDSFDNPEPEFQLVRDIINNIGLAPDSLWDEFLSEYDDSN